MRAFVKKFVSAMIMKNRGMNNTVNNRNSCTQSYNCVCFYPVIVRPLYIPNTQTHEHARAPGWNAHIAVAKLAATTNLQTHVLYVTSDVIVDLSFVLLWYLHLLLVTVNPTFIIKFQILFCSQTIIKTIVVCHESTTIASNA